MPNCLPYFYATASQIIHKSKCLLYAIVVTPDGSNNSYVDIYDGESTNDTLVARLRVVSTTSKVFRFNPALLLRKGLYVSFETNLSSVSVVSEPVEAAVSRK